MSRTLHYIYDPLCGWCYGATRLVAAAEAAPGIEVALHGGGLWPQPTSLPNDTRQYIKSADARVGAMNGVPYGDAYLSGLLFDPELMLESRSTTAAVLAAQAMGGRGLDMLRAIQSGHYVHGKHVVRADVLRELAAGIGLDPDEFATKLAEAPVDRHIAETRSVMGRIGANGFPTFLLEVDGAYAAVPHQQFAGNPEGFVDWLQAAQPASAA